MDPEARARLTVVLVRARNPANIGAVARAMHDFGFSSLRIVNPYPVPFAAARSAVDASTVLAAAQEFTTLAEALADCTLVLGTTAVGERNLEHPLHTVDAAAPLVDDALIPQAARVALLFGSEKTGLSNEELSHCHALVTIPMHQPPGAAGPARHLSMNLGQAAAVCLYSLARPTRAPNTPPEPAATGADLERLAALLGELMQHSGYTRRNPANAREVVIRRLIHRMHLAPSDTALWTGILRQTLHALRPDNSAAVHASNAGLPPSREETLD